MSRPIGVTLLAAGAFVAGLYQIWLSLIYLGIVDFNVVGKAVSFPEPQWGATLWSWLIAAIWFWVAVGFWNVRAYAWSFGNFISLFTLIWGFFSLLFGNTIEAQSIPWLLAGAVYLYLNYPGVRQRFVRTEMAMLTPEQQAAMEQLAAANAAAAARNAPPPAALAAAPTTTSGSSSGGEGTPTS